MLLLLLACTAASTPDKDGRLEDTSGVVDPLDTADSAEPTDTADSAAPDDSAEPVDTADSAEPPEPLWILLRDPFTTDSDGDGLWSPGEVLTVTVTLENVQEVDFMYYPGILVSTDHRDIPDPGGNWFFGLFAGQSSELSVTLHPAASIPLGDTVNIAIDLSTIGCPDTPEACLPSQRLELSRVVGE